MKTKQEDQKEMVGGCCVCSDENGWAENPLVYCDGQGCNVAVHQACYGIVTVPTGAWFCRKCESQERAARVRCELCPSKDGALKRTDSGGWAHVVCALYIPEVRFGNVTTMEPIMLQLIPQERFNKSCYLCDEAQRGSKATIGACMQCNRAGCKNHFHVTCAQAMGLLCEEAGNYLDNVKYCGYCQYHYNKLRRGSHVKTIPPYRPVPHDALSSDEDKASSTSDSKDRQKRRSGKSSPVHDSGKHLTREVKVNLGDISGPSKAGGLGAISCESSSQEEPSVNMDFSLNLGQGSLLNVKSETKVGDKILLNTSSMPNLNTTNTTTTIATLASNKQMSISTNSGSDSKTTTGTFLSSGGLSHSTTTVTSSFASSSSGTAGPSVSSSSESTMGNVGLTVTPSTSVSSTILTSTASTISDNATTVVSTVISLPSKIKATNAVSPATSSHATPPSLPVSIVNSSLEKAGDRQRKTRRNGSGSRLSSVADEIGIDESSSNLVICEERNLSTEKIFGKSQTSSEDKLNVHFTTNVSVSAQKLDTFSSGNADAIIGEPMKRARSSSQDRGRRSKRGASSVGSAPAPKRGRVAMSSREKESSRDSGASSPESLSPETLQTKRGGRGTVKSTPEVKETKENTLTSVITNGVGANALLLGNQINPASAVAQKMADTLHAELEAHSIYKDEEKVNINLIGPALPGKKESSSPGAILNVAQPPPLPQSLEQLLERQWEQGSQFLMEQAQHFDIASLLSCLHQLRQENVRLEETVNNLIARRDHLLAVNARLSVPLVSTQSTTHASTSTTSALSLSSSLAGTTGTPSTSSHPTTLSNTASLVAITPTAPSPISTALVASQLQITHSSNLPSTAVMTSSRGVHPSQQRHPSGGSAHIIHGTPSSSVSGGRGTSPHDRRNPHQGPPLENGLAEPEYRYRSPGTDHHPRQQSPMLPPGAQPSPTSLRQSPASSTYHSGSPHAGVPSLSPSGVTHPPPPPQHPLVAHGSHSGHPQVLASSSHGPPHTVALSRTSDHRAELLRIASTQVQSTPGVGYGQVYMVSPPVPGPHHSPVGMQQHPSHSQMRRMEVVETGRGSHTLEKR